MFLILSQGAHVAHGVSFFAQFSDEVWYFVVFTM